MNVILKKIAIAKGLTSMVGVGDSCFGGLYISPKDMNDLTREIDLLDIKVGEWVLVFNFSNFIKTSEIKEIVKRTKDKVIFKTTTSTYEINIVKE